MPMLKRRKRPQPNVVYDDVLEENRIFDEMGAAERTESSNQSELGESSNPPPPPNPTVEVEEETQVHEKLYLAHLPPLPIRIYDGPFLNVKISSKRKFKTFDDVVPRAVMERIRSDLPNLKWLYDLPPSPRARNSGATLSHLLHSRLVTQKRNELWFKINDMPLRFSRKEFVLVSGMNLRRLYTRNELADAKNNTTFADKYFDSGRFVTEQMIRDAIYRTERDNVEDEAKLTIGLLLCRYWVDGKKTGLDREMFGIIDNLDLCNKYDWGTKIWTNVYKEMQKSPINMSGANPRTYMMTYSPWIFAAWIAESVPLLGEWMAHRRGGRVFPRVNKLVWSNSWLSDANMDTLLAQIDRVRPTLEPTEAEKEQWYYQQYLLLEATDEVDPVVDALATLFTGAVEIHRGPPPAERQPIQRQTQPGLDATPRARRQRIDTDNDLDSTPPARRQRIVIDLEDDEDAAMRQSAASSSSNNDILELKAMITDLSQTMNQKFEELSQSIRQGQEKIEQAAANMNQEQKELIDQAVSTILQSLPPPPVGGDAARGHQTAAVAPPPPPPPPPPKEPVFSCPLCMGPLVEERSTRCGHIFCKKCIKAAVYAQGKCPTCRRNITRKDTIRIYLPTIE